MSGEWWICDACTEPGNGRPVAVSRPGGDLPGDKGSLAEGPGDSPVVRPEDRQVGPGAARRPAAERHFYVLSGSRSGCCPVHVRQDLNVLRMLRVRLEDLLLGLTGVGPRGEFLRVQENPERVGVECSRSQPLVQVLDGLERTHRELDLIVIGIAVVHRGRDTVVDALLGKDALLLQRPVLADKLPEILDLVGGVMESRGVRGSDWCVWLADDGEPVLRVVPRKEADRGV